MNYEELLERFTRTEEEFYSGKGDYMGVEIFCREILLVLPEQYINESDNWEQIQRVRSYALCLLASALRDLGNITEALQTAENARITAKELNNKDLEAKAAIVQASVYKNLKKNSLALDLYRQSWNIYKEIGDKQGICKSLIGLGAVYCDNLNDYLQALDSFTTALAIAEEFEDTFLIALIFGNMGTVYSRLSDYPRALEYMGRSLANHEAAGAKSFIAQIIKNIGSIYAAVGDYDKALEYSHKALEEFTALGMKPRIVSTISDIGRLYISSGDYSSALQYISQSLALFEEYGNTDALATEVGNMGVIYHLVGDYQLALEYYSRALAYYEELGNKNFVAWSFGNIGELYAEENFDGYDPVKAEENLLKCIALSDEIGDTSNNLYMKVIADLYRKQKRWEEVDTYFQRYYAYEQEHQNQAGKKAAEKFTHERREAEREKEIAVAKAKHEATEQLLHNVLPPSIADKMLGGTKLIAEKLSNVSVLFADIVEFTKLSQRISAEELVEGLDRIFSEFDALAEKYGLEKIKTIGDAYMVVSGAPEPRTDHAEVIALMAIEMVEAMKQFRSIATGEEIQLRIGIHSGDVVAGVIGKKKFAYDLWGDAVNTASRMESHGEAGKIHVSEEFRNMLISTTYNELPMQFIPRGEMNIKGKGMMKTYFLEKA